MRNRLIVPALVVALSAAGSVFGEVAISSAGASPTPIKVGMIVEKSGLYSTYIAEYDQGFKIGLQYATKGTDKVSAGRST